MKFPIQRWFESHHHLRDKKMLRLIAPYAASSSWGAIVMSNLPEPVTTVERAKEYRGQITEALQGRKFEPKLTCYLTDSTTPEEIRRGFEEGVWVAAKLYFAGKNAVGHTTNSAKGVTDFTKLYPVFAVMEEIGMPLLVHGEIPNPEHDVFDLERICVEVFYKPTRKMFPGLKICAEHMSTVELASFVTLGGPNTFGTITPQHLSTDRNALFTGGLKPHNWCLPILKRRENMLAMQRIAMACSRVGAGTDSAPHPRHKKECCGCAAGCFNAIEAPAVYAQVFDECGMFRTQEGIATFEGFMSTNIPVGMYGFTPPDETMEFSDETPWKVPETIEGYGQIVRPWKAGETLKWSYNARF